jgi:hypothetical protein
MGRYFTGSGRDHAAASSFGNRIRLHAAAVSETIQAICFMALAAGLAHEAARLHPTEAFVDPFADTAADGITWMTRRAAINDGAPVRYVLRNVRRPAQGANFRHEVRHVIALVRSQDYTFAAS